MQSTFDVQPSDRRTILTTCSPNGGRSSNKWEEWNMHDASCDFLAKRYKPARRSQVERFWNTTLPLRNVPPNQPSSQIEIRWYISQMEGRIPKTLDLRPHVTNQFGIGYLMWENGTACRAFLFEALCESVSARFGRIPPKRRFWKEEQKRKSGFRRKHF